MNVIAMLSKNKWRKSVAGTLFVLPSFIAFSVFMVYPLIYSLYLSFMDWNMFDKSKSVFVGLENYIDALQNDYFQIGITNNIKLAVFAVPVLIAISLCLAALLNRPIVARGGIRAMFFLPYITMITASAVVFSALMNTDAGPINNVLRAIGVQDPPGWLTTTAWALTSVGIFWVWKNVGYCTVIFLASLQAISPSYYEASSLDGASKLQQFWYITVPLVSPTTFFLMVTSVIHSFQIFAEVNVMTAGGPGRATVTTVFHIYDAAFVDFQMGYASAASWLFFILVLCVTGIQWAGQKKWVKFM